MTMIRRARRTTSRVVGRRVFGAALLLWLAAPQRPLGQVPPEFLLAPGKAGPLEVGLPVDEVYARVGRERTRMIDRYREGMFDPALEVRLPGTVGQAAVTAPVREWPCRAWSLQGLDVRDHRFRTKEGVGVGSSLAEVSKVYEVTLSQEEGPHAWVPALRMNFRLADASMAPSARITSVWLPGDPVAIRAARCAELGVLGR